MTTEKKSELEKAVEAYHDTINVDRHYPFELGSFYSDDKGNRLTFGGIYSAGVCWLAARILERARQCQIGMIDPEDNTIQMIPIEELEAIVKELTE